MKIIKLPCGKDVKVDSDDYVKLIKFKWYSQKNPVRSYPYRQVKVGKKIKTILMHRQIMEFPEKDIDHINGDKLDCRRENLRLCTQSQNSANAKLNVKNTSGFKGVYFLKTKGKLKKPYYVRIGVNYKNLYSGYFKTAKEAAKEYDKLAIKYFGEFAKTNFGEIS